MIENNVSNERITDFLKGYDDQTGIIAMECSYSDDEVSIIYKNLETNNKFIKKDDFKPFLWATRRGAEKLFVNKKTNIQNKQLLKSLLNSNGISVKKLNIYNNDGKTEDRLYNGYSLIFQANKKMSYGKFLSFFKRAGVDIYSQDKLFLTVNPVEQYMIYTGKRFFKGIEDYDDLDRLQFDLETGGLNPEVDRIDQIGIRTNKGFEKILAVEGKTKEEKDTTELLAIIQFFNVLKKLKPDIITGHNSENFDWPFIIKRCEMLGTTVEDVTKDLFKFPLYKSQRKTVLKLGGEIEYFNKTNLWGYNITDSLHAVRRAQAIDSNMKKADLKYVTKYSKLNKQNRVYVPGDKIVSTWNDNENEYAFNDKNGDWYKITPTKLLKEDYIITTGKHIVERYLQDDLYETDKVELRYNQPNFLLGKLLPTTFSRAATMGTAGIWKLIMMAWSYENNLTIPYFGEKRSFTGGLSRLLSVGYVPNVVKLDYNSLYPSIIITWAIQSGLDISNVMLKLLEYVLSERERFKGLKSNAKKEINKIKDRIELAKENTDEYNNLMVDLQRWTNEENSNDKKQLPFKIFGNSFFGSFGSGNIFPWSDIICAEKTTCIGRQSLRLMVSHFEKIGYKAIVGDSFTEDTPVYIKYKNNDYIDILPIKDLINESEIKTDEFDREYDLSNKDYYVLCRSGWVDVKYIYRHKTDKDVYNINFDEFGEVGVTSDHSLFDNNGEKIHTKNIKINTLLEENNNIIETVENNNLTTDEVYRLGIEIFNNKSIEKIPITIINSNNIIKKTFLNGYYFSDRKDIINDFKKRTKTFKAGIIFIKKQLE